MSRYGSSPRLSVREGAHPCISLTDHTDYSRREAALRSRHRHVDSYLQALVEPDGLAIERGRRVIGRYHRDEQWQCQRG